MFYIFAPDGGESRDIKSDISNTDVINAGNQSFGHHSEEKQKLHQHQRLQYQRHVTCYQHLSRPPMCKRHHVVTE